jgi:iduronate 2-sulfatase
MGRKGQLDAALAEAYPWYDNPVLKNSMEIPEFFRSKCYYVMGTGKLNHDELQDAGCDTCLWDEFYAGSDFGPSAYDGSAQTPHPELPPEMQAVSAAIDYNFARLSHVPYQPGGPGNAGWRYMGGADKGGPRGTFTYNSPEDRSLLPDEYNANWAIEKIGELTLKRKDPVQPWLLMVGLVRPHTPMYCPDEYFEHFDPDTLQLPEGYDKVVPNTHYHDVSDAAKMNGYILYDALKKSYGDDPNDVTAGLKMWMQAYYACVEFVDEQLGKIVQALKTSPFWTNTITVMLSDNGWQNGPKQYVFKLTPWEDGILVPLIIKAPGVTTPGTNIRVPITLTDIYPTLMDLTGYAGENTVKNAEGHALTGFSLKPLMVDPSGASWNGPDAALSQLYPTANKILLPWPDCNEEQACEHNSIRQNLGDDEWRYIIYNDGVEELYNHKSDPLEEANVVEDYPAIAAELKQSLLQVSGMDESMLGLYDHVVPPKPNHCQFWCANNAAGWTQKCNWGDCNECPNCA